jgi:ABC-type transport system involved in Fe-S cluster assembly fused permease/ATPase subunit
MFMQIRFVMPPPANQPTPLRKVAGVIVTVALAIVALMFSAVFFAVIAVVGLIAWAYFWWKTRAVRKQMREFAAQSQSVMREQSASNDEIFEGEVIRVVDPKDEK